VTTEMATGSTAEGDNARPVSRITPTRAVVLALVVGALAGFGGGFAASGLHPGPRGRTGTQGVQGLQGVQGVQGDQGQAGATGKSGTAAQVSELGVCYDTTNQSSNGTFWITGVFISSPSRHSDGTTFCSSGTYVPVQPQPGIGG
jgi:hypothetical protein